MKWVVRWFQEVWDGPPFSSTNNRCLLLIPTTTSAGHSVNTPSSTRYWTLEHVARSTAELSSSSEGIGANCPETTRTVPDLELLSRVPHGCTKIVYLSRILAKQLAIITNQHAKITLSLAIIIILVFAWDKPSTFSSCCS